MTSLRDGTTRAALLAGSIWAMAACGGGAADVDTAVEIEFRVPCGFNAFVADRVEEVSALNYDGSVDAVVTDVDFVDGLTPKASKLDTWTSESSRVVGLSEGASRGPVEGERYFHYSESGFPREGIERASDGQILAFSVMQNLDGEPANFINAVAVEQKGAVEFLWPCPDQLNSQLSRAAELSGRVRDRELAFELALDFFSPGSAGQDLWTALAEDSSQVSTVPNASRELMLPRSLALSERTDFAALPLVLSPPSQDDATAVRGVIEIRSEVGILYRGDSLLSGALVVLMPESRALEARLIDIAENNAVVDELAFVLEEGSEALEVSHADGRLSLRPTTKDRFSATLGLSGEDLEAYVSSEFDQFFRSG